MKKTLVLGFVALTAGLCYGAQLGGLNRSSDVVLTSEGNSNYLYQAGSTNKTLIDAAIDLSKTAINVKTFGALGNGVSNDTAAIQAALNYIKTNNSALFFPPGIYVIVAALTNNPAIDGTVVYGSGEGRSIIQQTTDSANAFSVLKGRGNNQHAEALTIRNLSIIGPGETSGGSGVGGYGIYIEGSSGNLARFKLDGVRIAQFAQGIHASGVDQLQIESSWIGHCDIGVNFSGVVNAAVIQSSALNLNFGTNLVASSGRGLSIIGCDIGGTEVLRHIVLNGCSSTVIIGCNFEVYPSVDYCIHHNTAGALLTLSGNWFHGYNSPTNTYLAYTGQNHTSVTGNRSINMSPGGRIFRGHWEGQIVGWQDRTQDMALVELSGGDGYVFPSPFGMVSTEYIAGNTNNLPDEFSRGRMMQVIGTTTTAADDMVVDYRIMTAGVPSYHQSSIINDKMLLGPNTWSNVQTFASSINVNYKSGASIKLQDWVDINTGTSGGTTIANATTQKLGFWGKNGVVQPAAVVNATNEAHAVTQLNTLLSRLRATGLIGE